MDSDDCDSDGSAASGQSGDRTGEAASFAPRRNPVETLRRQVASLITGRKLKRVDRKRRRPFARRGGAAFSLRCLDGVGAEGWPPLLNGRGVSMSKFLNLSGVVAAVTLATLGATTTVYAMTAQQCVNAGDRCHSRCINDNFGGAAMKACKSQCATVEFFCVTKSSDLGDAAQKRKEVGDKKEGGGKLPPKKGTQIVIDPVRPKAPGSTTGPSTTPVSAPATKGSPPSYGGLLSKPFGGKWLP
jgi:hypothetical protein